MKKRNISAVSPKKNHDGMTRKEPETNMAKRFTDTSIWERDWFLSLTPAEKCAWRYITDNCDNVGVWPCSFRKAEFCIGAEIYWKGLIEMSHGNIKDLGDGNWWVVDFCDFQYGELREDCKPHQSYLSLLRKHGLEGYPKGIHTLKEKDKEKDKEKEVKSDVGFDEFWTAYPRKVNRRGAEKAWSARFREKVLVPDEVMTALANYTKACAGKELEYVMHPSTFLGPAMRWKDYLVTFPKRIPSSVASDGKWICTMCRKQYGKDDPMRIGGVCVACEKDLKNEK